MSTIAEINDSVRSIIKGTYEVLMSPGAVSAADALAKGYVSLGDISDFSVNPQTDPKSHFGARRGKMVKTKVATGNNELGYGFNVSNLTKQNLGLIVGHDPDFDFGSEPTSNARSAISAAAGTAFDFDEGDDGVGSRIDGWYPIRDSSGNRVRNLTACTFAGVEAAYGASADATALVEGIDYHLDKILGMVQFFKVAIADDVITPTITCPAITSASNDYMERIKPLELLIGEGYFIVACFDEDNNSIQVLEHEPFKGRVMSNGSLDFGDDFASGPLTIDVLDGSFMAVRK